MSAFVSKFIFRVVGNLALFLLISQAFTPTALGQTKTHSEYTQGEKSLQVWGQTVHYNYFLQEDPQVDFDGEVSTEMVNGQQTYRVLINPIFFKKEAMQLFHRFLREDGELEQAGPVVASEVLFHLEKTLLEKNHGPAMFRKWNRKTRRELKKLQEGLERLAWYPLFEKCRNGAGSIAQAERDFIREFTQIRIQTIEQHEASHVLDLMKAGERSYEPGFGRFTELNAFYAELAMGSNPLDVMAQAIAGLIDEIRQKKPVDHSVTKVATVVRFLKNCPRVASRLAGGKMPRCCLEILGEISLQEFRLAAQELYQNNRFANKSFLIAVR